MYMKYIRLMSIHLPPNLLFGSRLLAKEVKNISFHCKITIRYISIYIYATWDECFMHPLVNTFSEAMNTMNTLRLYTRIYVSIFLLLFF